MVGIVLFTKKLICRDSRILLCVNLVTSNNLWKRQIGLIDNGTSAVSVNQSVYLRLILDAPYLTSR